MFVNVRTELTDLGTSVTGNLLTVHYSYLNMEITFLFDILYYDQKTLDKALDFNLTCEWIGGGRFPNRWIVVSQKVRQIVLKNKLLCKGCFKPILSVPPF